jgi:hypothetical protein
LSKNKITQERVESLCELVDSKTAIENKMAPRWSVYFCALFFAAAWAPGALAVVLALFVLAVLLAVEPTSPIFCAGVSTALSTAELTCVWELCTPLSTAQFTVSPKPSTVFWALPFSLSLNEENAPPFLSCWLGAGAAVED